MIKKTKNAFTFIELIVAVALTMLLLEGMYSVFFSATALVRMSEETAEIGYEVAAMHQITSEDFARSPAWTTDYYLGISGDKRSITFQVSGKEGGDPVYIEYSMSDANGQYSTTDRSGTKLLRTVWRTRSKDVRTTEETDLEDGSTTMVVQNIETASFEAYYFDEDYLDASGNSSINHVAAWKISPVLDGDSRTRAIKLNFTINSTSNTIQGCPYSMVIPINY